MVTDAVLHLLTAVMGTILSPLPRGSALPLPDIAGLWDVIGGFDSLVPVLGPLVAGLTLLSALGVFLLVRLVLVVWNLVYP